MAVWPFYQNKVLKQDVCYSYSCKKPQWFKLIGVVLVLVGLILGACLIGSWFVKPPNKLAEDYSPKFYHWEPEKDVFTEILNNFVPELYKVKLVPFIWPGNFTFNGEVKIKFSIKEPTNKIYLDAVDLDIWENATRVEAEIFDLYPSDEPIKIDFIICYTSNYFGDRCKNSTSFKVYYQVTKFNTVKVTRQYYDTPKQVYVIETDQILSLGVNYWLHLNFTGKLKGYSQGFHRSSYIFDNQTRWIAASHFRLMGARSAFPCFDDPEFKSTFEISIAHPKNMTAVSNAPLLNTVSQVEGLPSYQWTNFKPAIGISTYQVAFMVFNFHKLQSSQDDRVRVWGPRKEISGQAQYALDVAPKIFRHYENIFDYHRLESKIDIVALPDLSIEVTGGFGLITFREAALFHNRSSVIKQEVRKSVARELIYQWFGKWVTLSWPSDVSFPKDVATYFEDIGVNTPIWKVSSQLSVEEIQSIFGQDSLESSYVVSADYPVDTYDFKDELSYTDNPNSTVTVTDHFMTTKTIRYGLQSLLFYLQDVKKDNFLRNFKVSSEEYLDLLFDSDINTIIDMWSDQRESRVLTVNRDYDKNEIQIISQDYPSITDKSLAIVCSNNHGLTKVKSIVRLTHSIPCPCHSDDFIIINTNQLGDYRVNYDVTNWRRIISGLRGQNFSMISTMARAQLVNDALNLAREGKLDYSTALDVISYLAEEIEYLPWKLARKGTSYLVDMLDTKSSNLLKEYIQRLTNKVLEKIGSEEKPDDIFKVKLTRVNVNQQACMPKYQDCHLRSHLDELSLDTRNEPEFFVSKQIFTRFFESLANNDVKYRSQSFHFIKDYWTQVKSHIGSSTVGLSYMIKVSTRRLISEHSIRSLRLFKKNYKSELGPAMQTVEEAIEQVQKNNMWLKRNKETIFRWLKDNDENKKCKN